MTAWRKMDGLAEALADPSLSDRAIELLRHALERVTIRQKPGSFTIGLDGSITSMVSLAPGRGANAGQAILDERTACSVELVAGARRLLPRSG